MPSLPTECDAIRLIVVEMWVMFQTILLQNQITDDILQL